MADMMRRQQIFLTLDEIKNKQQSGFREFVPRPTSSVQLSKPNQQISTSLSRTTAASHPLTYNLLGVDAPTTPYIIAV